MDRIVGDLRSAEVIAGGFVGSVAADGALSVEIQAIMGSTCQLGLGKLTAQEH
jgi:glycine reductase